MSARTSRSRWVSAASGSYSFPHQQLGDDFRVERGAPRRDPAQRVKELGHVGDAVLQQVTDAAGVGGEQLAAYRSQTHLREHQDRGGRPLFADEQRRPDALVRVARGHPDIGDHHVGPFPLDGRDECGPVSGGGGHLEPGAFQQLHQAGEQQHRVLADHHPESGRGGGGAGAGGSHDGSVFHSARRAVAGRARAAQLAGSSAPRTAMTSAARASTASRSGPNTCVKLAGTPVCAVPAMACNVAVFSATATGAAIAPASTAGTMIQHTTMVSTGHGPMPSDLKTPRSWTRSPVVISTVLSTPSPAAIATISESRPISSLAIE